MIPNRPLILGHRGAPFRAVENTVEAFVAAIDEGADGVELDVHLTRDGVLALHHDTVVNGRPAWTRSFAELQQDVGHKLSTLDEVFARLPSTATIFVEIKRQGSVLEAVLPDRIVDLVRQRPGFAGNPSRTIVGSFDPVLVRLFHHVAPELFLGLILERRGLPSPDGFEAATMPWLGCLSMDVDLLDGPTCERAAAAGLLTLTWSVDGEGPLRRCFDRFPRLHGVITKRPAQAVSVRK